MCEVFHNQRKFTQKSKRPMCHTRQGGLEGFREEQTDELALVPPPYFTVTTRRAEGVDQGFLSSHSLLSSLGRLP